MIEHPSPNYNDRPAGCLVDTIVIHYTGMQTAAEALARLCDRDAQVSAHYLIDLEGQVYSLVAEEKRAWHAGVSHWQGVDNLNHSSIGIELVNKGHEFGYHEFPARQISSLIQLLKAIHSRHPVIPGKVVGHSDIAPERKQDPGERFPWQRLFDQGFGLLPVKTATVKDTGPVLKVGDSGPQVAAAQAQLAAVGYAVRQSGLYDQNTEMCVRAFQRHWRQENISGDLDCETLIRLDNIKQQILETI